MPRAGAKADTLPNKSQQREIKKLKTERDRLKGRLDRSKLKKKQKRLQGQRQTLAMQVVSLTFETKAVIDGEN